MLNKTKTIKTKKGPWSREEFVEMWKLKNAGMSNSQIAKRIHRSVSGISAQIRATHDYMSK